MEQSKQFQNPFLFFFFFNKYSLKTLKGMQIVSVFKGEPKN